MIEAADPDPIRRNRKAISALFPYAARQEREGRHEMLEVILQIARASTQSGFIWHRIGPLATTLLDEEGPVSPKRAMVLALPHIPWQKLTNREYLIKLWAVAASAVPYTDDIGQSVVDTLLQITYYLGSLSPHIPIGMWSWLNKRPSLYPANWEPHHFLLHYLLQDPELPASVIADCLLIVAIDLGCDVPESNVRTPDKRYAHLPNFVLPT